MKEEIALVLILNISIGFASCPVNLPKHTNYEFSLNTNYPKTDEPFIKSSYLYGEVTVTETNGIYPVEDLVSYYEYSTIDNSVTNTYGNVSPGRQTPRVTKIVVTSTTTQMVEDIRLVMTEIYKKNNGNCISSTYRIQSTIISPLCKICFYLDRNSNQCRFNIAKCKV